MSPPTMAAPRSGVSTQSRNALAGQQLTRVSNAARKALIDRGDGLISAASVNRLVRRFERALHRSRLGLDELLTLEPQRRRAAMGDPDLLRVIAYMDRTGEDAVNHVMRERGH